MPHVQSDALELESMILSEAAQLLGGSLDPEPSIHGVLRLLSQLVGLNRGRVVLPDGDVLRIHYAYGLTDVERGRGVYRVGEGITGRVMKTAHATVVQDIDQEPDFLCRAVTRATLPQETVAFIAVPILRDRVPVGVLGVHRLRNRPRPFHADLHLLRIVAAMIGQTLRIAELAAVRTERLQSENAYLKCALDQQGSRYGILGESVALQQVLSQALSVAATDATVMLLGESGTGKEKFARMIHLSSPRADNAFICINCAAIPEQLLESELFGYERGAFTGAHASRPGKVELANGGTLFLDEIGDMNLDLQAKLLRLLQERVVQRVGGTKDIPVDLRIVTATHKDLQAAVNAGRFRLDLYYRLNVIPLLLPPLRARTGDVGLLARHFLNAYNHRYGRNKNLGRGVLERLESYPWPGNIRQLENVIERAVLTVTGNTIQAADIERILGQESRIGTEPQPPALIPGAPAAPAARGYLRVDVRERDTILNCLRRYRGNKTQAALALGLTPRQLHYRLKKLAL